MPSRRRFAFGEFLEPRLIPSSFATVAVHVATAIEENPRPDPEPSPGPYPGEDSPVEYPDPPPSGPVGPGFAQSALTSRANLAW
jgi:hypothetical protein